jgi:DNA-binding MarR family transcriptional regulator
VSSAGPRPIHPASQDRLSLCSTTERRVLDAVDFTGTLTDSICRRTTLDLGTVALAIDRLEDLGLVRSDGAAWVRS